MATHAPTDKTVYDYPESPHVRLAIQRGHLALCGAQISDPATGIVDPYESYWSNSGVTCPHCLTLIRLIKNEHSSQKTHPQRPPHSSEVG